MPVITSRRRQVTVADDALVAVPGLQIGMLAEKVRDLASTACQKGTCPVAQDFVSDRRRFLAESVG